MKLTILVNFSPDDVLSECVVKLEIFRIFHPWNLLVSFQ